MFESIIVLSTVLLMVYVYCNEKAFQRGKMPFSRRIENNENNLCSQKENY